MKKLKITPARFMMGLLLFFALIAVLTTIIDIVGKKGVSSVLGDIMGIGAFCGGAYIVYKVDEAVKKQKAKKK